MRQWMEEPRHHIEIREVRQKVYRKGFRPKMRKLPDPYVVLLVQARRNDGVVCARMEEHVVHHKFGTQGFKDTVENNLNRMKTYLNSYLDDRCICSLTGHNGCTVAGHATENKISDVVRVVDVVEGNEHP